MEFGELAGEADYLVGAESVGNFLGKFGDAMAGFVEDDGFLCVADGFEKADAGSGFGWEKTDVTKGVGREPRGGERGDEGAGAGNGDDGKLAAAAFANDTEARVAQGGGASVADEGDVFPVGDAFGKDGCQLLLVVLVIGEEGAGDAEVLQEF